MLFGSNMGKNIAQGMPKKLNIKKVEKKSVSKKWEQQWPPGNIIIMEVSPSLSAVTVTAFLSSLSRNIRNSVMGCCVVITRGRAGPADTPTNFFFQQEEKAFIKPQSRKEGKREGFLWGSSSQRGRLLLLLLLFPWDPLCLSSPSLSLSLQPLAHNGGISTVTA